MKQLIVIFPYSANLSDNKRLGFNPKIGRFYSKNEYKQAMANLVLAIAFAKASQMAVFAPGRRVWIDLRVYRPGAQADASNYVKGVNDAIAQAISVNDRYFDGSYTGFIDKKNPRFEILVSQ